MAVTAIVLDALTTLSPQPPVKQASGRIREERKFGEDITTGSMLSVLKEKQEALKSKSTNVKKPRAPRKVVLHSKEQQSVVKNALIQSQIDIHSGNIGAQTATASQTFLPHVLPQYFATLSWSSNNNSTNNSPARPVLTPNHIQPVQHHILLPSSQK
ncbi:unnamed protein product [Didymodactylos carnosus]|uniref:Uncharacterized protein n=1 Tax=Didymodactylos carnosus TaxID=1234261 RepID=A0A815YFF8_9BILA|nr:unnamed protein product [Didymodactylos carnosus]CAF4431872.1 unnamed protein product [Didymodactylos carnosus]